jgi:hypothetical protein
MKKEEALKALDKIKNDSSSPARNTRTYISKLQIIKIICLFLDVYLLFDIEVDSYCLLYTFDAVFIKL